MLEDINFIELNQLSKLKYREQVIELYFQTFTTGEYAQFIERSSIEKTIDGLINIGCGVLALSDEKLVGILLGSPLSEHSDFAFNNIAFDIDKTIYINEVGVDTSYRGRGIAEKMIGVFFNNIRGKYNNAVIRVWDKNIPALSLYNKLNFEPIARITQTKFKTSGEEFEMNKIYLSKNLKASN